MPRFRELRAGAGRNASCARKVDDALFASRAHFYGVAVPAWFVAHHACRCLSAAR